MEKRTLLNLPPEIHDLITKHLDPLSLVRLKMTCRHFYTLISPLNLEQLLRLETSPFGWGKDLYTCRDCIKLLPRARFADNMVKRRKRKFGDDAGNRFCVDCGIHPRPGTTRYCRGSHIVIQGEQYVLCRSCGAFGEAAVERGKNMSECYRCRRFSRASEQQAEEYRAKLERARLRAEQTKRKARRRALWGSDYESDEEDIPPSPTWSEMMMDEADVYMNSPKAGSE